MNFILGKKLGMTQVFDENGEAFPVTLVEAGPCKVTEVKNKDRDGYEAVQLGFEELNEKKAGKSKRTKPYRHLKEVRGSFDISPEDTISVDAFSEGDKVQVKGTSKGKGFEGVVKRWGFKGAATKTHGTKHNERKPGSIGSMFPQRVFKGKKMPGRMGTNKITVKNLKVVSVDPEKNLMAIKGALPGKNGGILMIEKV